MTEPVTEVQKLRPKLKVRKASCSNCQGIRNCSIKGHHLVRGTDGYADWCTEWYLLECRGCEHVFAQTSYTNSEDFDFVRDEYGQESMEHTETVHYWPALAKRKKPEWLTDYSIDADGAAELNEPLQELYGALNNDLKMLATIGIRTCFDVASMLLKINPALPFQKKLQGLVEAGHIGMVDRAQLETLVEAGSASIHRGWQPSADDLNTMMDVLENFIHGAFVSPKAKRLLHEKVTKMQSGVPAKKKLPKKTPPKKTK